MVSLSPDSMLFAGTLHDPEITALFSTESFARAMLKVEAALARAEARVAIMPETAADRIEAAAGALRVDFERLQAGMDKDGFPVIELVRQLREAVGGEAASYVHWGATTQDIIDTALVLQTRAALSHIEDNLHGLIRDLAQMADHHRRTLMAGRTHSQQALPIPFGLKAAGWLAPLLRHDERLDSIRFDALAVQFGGAVGTLASLGDGGVLAQAALAAELDLITPQMPWHTQRDPLVELAGWLSILTGSLAKMAQDIILLAQTEVGEVRETSDASRGGSSTMPQKSNPIASEFIIAAARMNASLLASMHQAMIQEHERGTHGWQMELATLPQMLALTSAALKRAVFLSEHLEIDVVRMRRNVAASNGLMMAEAISFALAEALGRDKAKALVTEACRVAAAEGRHLVDVVRERTSVSADWDALRDESVYFGSANAFIDRVLGEID